MASCSNDPLNKVVSQPYLRLYFNNSFSLGPHNKKESETDSDSPMVHPAGVEPTTPGTGNQCSIH